MLELPCKVCVRPRRKMVILRNAGEDPIAHHKGNIIPNNLVVESKAFDTKLVGRTFVNEKGHIRYQFIAPELDEGRGKKGELCRTPTGALTSLFHDVLGPEYCKKHKYKKGAGAKHIFGVSCEPMQVLLRSVFGTPAPPPPPTSVILPPANTTVYNAHNNNHAMEEIDNVATTNAYAWTSFPLLSKEEMDALIAERGDFKEFDAMVKSFALIPSSSSSHPVALP